MSSEDLTKMAKGITSALGMQSPIQVKESPSQREISYLKSQLKGMEILLQQNAELEREVSRLADELDTATNSVIKRGYLHKWRDREISFASKWGLRYFVLQGSTLSYFGDDHDQRPRRTFDLSRCLVRSEGTKKQDTYHVFSLYVVNGNEAEMAPSLLLRLSSENGVEARQWIDMLEQACTLAEYNSAMLSDNKPVRKSNSAEKFKDMIVGLLGPAGNDDDEDWSNGPISATETLVDHSDDLSPIMLKRVRSSSAMLKKIYSRQTMAREILGRRAPQVFTAASNSKVHPPSQRKQGIVTSALKTFPGSKPMHIQSNPSPLSNDVRPGEQNYRGFFNLGVIILLLSHARLIIDSHAKHGFVPAWRGIEDAASMPLTAQWALSRPGQSVLQWCLSISISYILETAAFHGFLSEGWMLVLNVVLGTANIVLPTLWVWRSLAHPGACMVYLFQSVILWMKLISYAHANRDLRKSKREQEKAKAKSAINVSQSASQQQLFDHNSKPLDSLSEVKDLQAPFLRYGDNLRLKNLLWFCIAPTLTYQLNYPQAPRTRWPHVVTLLLRIGLVAALILFSIEQYIVPTLRTSMEPLQKLQIGELMERVIKLSIPNTYVWLLVFYLYFHLWLNLLAELTRFGDRAFYKDWWNARTIESYWRNWNLPVHHWCLRHLCTFPTLILQFPPSLHRHQCLPFSPIAFKQTIQPFVQVRQSSSQHSSFSSFQPWPTN